ncbi:MAG: hypothetical protein R2681_03775 [Pyrinomonadaceae bacterium]
MTNNNIEKLIKDLPDEDAAKRFYENLQKDSPSASRKLEKNEGLGSDVLTIASFSPLLATTLLQNPDYISWLDRHRKIAGVTPKDELFESLARFALTNSELEPGVMISRFRRRELIRIYLKDIRGLCTIAEITEEISNLADAILEYALQISRQELDNKFGVPLEVDERSKSAAAKFCVVALGKLGSKELNYSSDIDLVFIYSNDGTTSGQGSRGKTSNREYFIKLAQILTKNIGRQIGEGAAYRVDLRLRPNGRVGSLAISLDEAVNYYKTSARMWEKQVLIRSRAAAGDEEIFHQFAEQTAPLVFSADATVADALNNVRRSKEKIDLEKIAKYGFDVKLGVGGIREIEFIAQALQLAFGGKDPWIRAPHTLISLSRLADRKLIAESELTELFDAYSFLRRLEHIVQMEHGLQTHLIPDDNEKRLLIAKRIGISSLTDFDNELKRRTSGVNRIFTRIFGQEYIEKQHRATEKESTAESEIEPILTSIEKSHVDRSLSKDNIEALKYFSEYAKPFAEMLTSNPELFSALPKPDEKFREIDFDFEVKNTGGGNNAFSAQLAGLRKSWARYMIRLAAFDLYGNIELTELKTRQTELAEASIRAAAEIAGQKLHKDLGSNIKDFEIGVLGLGKLGGNGMDYGSDLDLVLIYDDEKDPPVKGMTRKQFYSKAAEIFVTTLSSLTRDGTLYRVDLRLRPDGKNGATAIGRNALLNYLGSRAAIWEWLAYVKLRGIGGPDSLAKKTEIEARKTLHKAALLADKEKLKEETRRIRMLLEKQKTTGKKGEEINIKFGEGGLQDIYFAIRYLQLRDNVPDDAENRSSLFSLEKLHENGSLSDEDFTALREGYDFLSNLDHALRLTLGRSTRLLLGNKQALNLLAYRLNHTSGAVLLEKLTFHRLNVRASFDAVLEYKN